MLITCKIMMKHAFSQMVVWNLGAKLCHQCCKKILLGFYIFRGEKIRDDHIKNCKSRTWMSMQKQI